MIKILCCNEKCTAKDRKFEWDERPHLDEGGRLAAPGERGISFLVDCPVCGTPNKIRVVKLKKEDIVAKIADPEKGIG